MPNYNDLVKEHFPGATLEDCNTLLWNCTAFPFCDVNHTINQLKDMYQRSGGNVSVAVALAHQDLDEAMQEARLLEFNAKRDILLTYDKNKYILWIKGIPTELNHWEMSRLKDVSNDSYLIKGKYARLNDDSV